MVLEPWLTDRQSIVCSNRSLCDLIDESQFLNQFHDKCTRAVNLF